MEIARGGEENRVTFSSGDAAAEERERERENFIGNLIGLVVNSFRYNFSKIPATFNDVSPFPNRVSKRNTNEGNWIKPVSPTVFYFNAVDQQ